MDFDSPRGYLEFGVGYGDRGRVTDQFLVAAQGGVLVPFQQLPGVALDLGLFLVSNLFSSQEGTRKNLGAQAGLVVRFGGAS